MKIISVRHPWAALIIHHGKNIENRTWPTNHRSRIAIHAGKSRQNLRNDLEYVEEEHGIIIDPASLVFGAVIGSVDLVDCVTDHSSPWFQGEYGFVLADPFAYPKPIYCSGQLSLYNPDAILAAELAKYERLRGKR